MDIYAPSPQRIRNSLAIGNEAEMEWAPHFFQSLGWSFIQSSSYDNRINHFDYIISKQGNNLKVEVKAPKICHNSKYSNYKLVLSEYTGISGKPGWLKGQADLILQFISSDIALGYERKSALNVFPEPGIIQRFNRYNPPINEWFGRKGLSLIGIENQDIIRWDELSFYLKHIHSRLYILKNGAWQRQ